MFTYANEPKALLIIIFGQERKKKIRNEEINWSMPCECETMEDDDDDEEDKE